jgi:hypothetical protein
MLGVDSSVSQISPAGRPVCCDADRAGALLIAPASPRFNPPAQVVERVSDSAFPHADSWNVRAPQSALRDSEHPRGLFRSQQQSLLASFQGVQGHRVTALGAMGPDSLRRSDFRKCCTSARGSRERSSPMRDFSASISARMTRGSGSLGVLILMPPMVDACQIRIHARDSYES